MVASNFRASLEVILREEGGNDDDPRDHGGRTSRGITQGEWNIYLKSHPGLPTDVWKASQADINNIYRTQYWDPYCDDLPAGVDLCFFNASVNSGRTQAVKELQRALGIQADGMLGMATKQAIASYGNLNDLISKICDKRRAFYQSLRQYSIYGKGWMARTNRVEVTAKMMARGAPTIHPTIDTIPSVPSITVSAKAEATDPARPMISQGMATTGTIGSSVASGVVDQLQTASSALQGFSDTFKWVKIACIVIAIICAGLTIYALVYNKKVEQAL